MLQEVPKQRRGVNNPSWSVSFLLSFQQFHNCYDFYSLNSNTLFSSNIKTDILYLWNSRCRVFEEWSLNPEDIIMTLDVYTISQERWVTEKFHGIVACSIRQNNLRTSQLGLMATASNDAMHFTTHGTQITQLWLLNRNIKYIKKKNTLKLCVCVYFLDLNRKTKPQADS